ncbi:MAG: restriction endonuclease subunit S [Thermodesulfobacteriota bacterium]
MRKKVPVNWINIPLENVVLKGKGKKPKKLSKEKINGMVPYIDIRAFEKGIIEQYADIESSKIIDKSDVLVVWDGARFGLTGFGMNGAAGSTLMVLTPVLIHSKYLYFFINRYYDYINTHPKGTGTPHVNPDIFWKLEFPLSSLNEQKRIVAKLDQSMPKIDGVKERLERIPQIIKRFRQSVLNAAVTGKLTEKWREEHLEVESALNIVESIQKTRMKDANTKLKSEKIKEIYSSMEENDSSELPDSWKYTFLNKLCESFQYGTSSKSQKKGKIPVLRMGNLQNGRIDWSDLVYTSDKNEIEKYILSPKDVLFNRTNSAELVGKTSIYLGEYPAIYAGYLIKINNYKKLDSMYLNYALNSQYARAYCNRVKSDGVNQSNINAQKLGKFEIPFPPLEEQHEIVCHVDKLFTFADKLEEHYQKAKEKVDKFPQSVLSKAFRGELVPQDPNDEPAEKLLERIKEEKAKMEAELKKTKKNVGGRKKAK